MDQNYAQSLNFHESQGVFINKNLSKKGIREENQGWTFPERFLERNMCEPHETKGNPIFYDAPGFGRPFRLYKGHL